MEGMFGRVVECARKKAGSQVTCCQQFTMAMPVGWRVRYISFAPSRPPLLVKIMPMLVIECVRKLSSKDKFSDFWLETEMGQECCFTSDNRVSRKIWSMSVAWMLMFDVELEERMARETVPSPQALSWMMEPDGIGGTRVRLWDANCAVTAPPVAL